MRIAVNSCRASEKIKFYIPEYDESEDGGSRLSFNTFLLRYLVYLRDLDVSNLVKTHDSIKSLLKSVPHLHIDAKS